MKTNEQVNIKDLINVEYHNISGIPIHENDGTAAKSLDDKYPEYFSKSKTSPKWGDLPDQDKNDVDAVLDLASEIRGKCDTFVVVGIGGSYLGPKAALDFIGAEDGSPDILFAGYNLSGDYHAKLIEKIIDKEVCLCVISKSGETFETKMAFEFLKEFMVGKYGVKANERIFTVTDKAEGTLRSETGKERYSSLDIPSDVIGRYSVLSNVGLLPMAVAGIDVQEVLDGAKAATRADSAQEAEKLAYVRYGLLKSGKEAEVIETFEPSLTSFGGWMQQLYGESEGKQGSGLLPVNLSFSGDLHSMGQYLQEGKQIFFETMIDIAAPGEDIHGLNKYNKIMKESVIRSHGKIGIPIVDIRLADKSARAFGNAAFFFETVSALTAKLMGVNPFNQPGVEAYKSEMKKLLIKST